VDDRDLSFFTVGRVRGKRGKAGRDYDAKGPEKGARTNGTSRSYNEVQGSFSTGRSLGVD